ncbi:MAG TPA: DUF4760 domain-containing protein [Brevundimonas sp.]
MKMGAIFFGLVLAALTATAGWLSGAGYTAAQIAAKDSIAATLVVGYVAAGIALVAAVVAVWGVYSQRVVTRRQTTVQHIAALKADRSIQEQITKFIELTQQEGNLAKWADKDSEGTAEAQSINNVLNTYELLAVGIQHGIYEYRLIEQWQRSTINKYWEEAHSYVVALRKRVGTPTIWCEFEKLNDWVTKKKSPFLALWWTGFH